MSNKHRKAATARDIPGPTFDEPEATAATAEPLEEKMICIPETVIPEVVLKLPVAELDEGGYRTNRLDLTLTHSQSLGMAKLTKALDVAGRKLDNGKRVTTPNDAVRYLFEQANAQV